LLLDRRIDANEGKFAAVAYQIKDLEKSLIEVDMVKKKLAEI
jgi:hypothetical protein